VGHYGVLVVLDYWTRRIVGLGVHRGVVDGVALRLMFNRTVIRLAAADHLPVHTTMRCSSSISGRRTCGSSEYETVHRGDAMLKLTSLTSKSVGSTCQRTRMRA
jgi:hypothetical protein